MREIKHKKAQITFFVILGLALLVVIILAFIIFRSKRGSQEQAFELARLLGEDDTLLHNYVQSCLEHVAKDSIYQIGLQGGYVSAEPDPLYNEPGAGSYIYFDGLNVSVLLGKDNQNLLSLEEMSRRLARKIGMDLPACFNFDYFRDAGFEVVEPSWRYEADEIDKHCSVVIKENVVLVSLNYPVLLRRDGGEIQVSDYIASIPIGLSSAHNSALLMLKHIQSTGLPPAWYNLSNECSLYDVNGFTNIYLKDDNKIIQIVDFEPSPLVKNTMPTPFIFQFAVKDYDVIGGCSE